jgi:hypothetical protein
VDFVYGGIITLFFVFAGAMGFHLARILLLWPIAAMQERYKWKDSEFDAILNGLAGGVVAAVMFWTSM